MSTFPGHNVLDVVILKAAEDNVPTALEFELTPTKRVNVDAVMDASIHGFRLDGTDVGIVDSYGCPGPESVEVLKGSRQHLVTMRVALGWRVKSLGSYWEAVASLCKSGHRRLGFLVIVDQRQAGGIGNILWDMMGIVFVSANVWGSTVPG